MFPSFIIKNIFRFFGYNIKEAGKEIDKIRNVSLDIFMEWQELKKWEIVKYHYHNNNYYRRKIGSMIPDDWNQLPIIEKKNIQQNPANAISRPFQNRSKYKASTSGSTGTPLNFVKNKFCHARTWATIFNLYNMHGISPGSTEARFYGMPRDIKGKYTEKIKDLILNRKRFIIFDMSSHLLDEFINRFSRESFDYIYGYTHSIVLFAEHLIRKKIILKNICPSIEKVIVTAELCTEQEKKIIEEGTGLKVIVEYGASEFSIIAFECENGNQHIIEENLYVENNDKGEILITDLYNQAMPFIRYNIGDLGELQTNDCSSPLKNNRVLENLIGRRNDLIILPSGKVSPGLTFYYISRGILEKSRGAIKEMQVRQVAVDLIELDVISSKELHDYEKRIVETEIEAYLKEKVQVKINNLESIPQHPSGKIMPFRSEIDNNNSVC